MSDEERLIQKYINEKKELQKLVLQIVERTDTNEESDFQNLLIFLDTHQYQNNKKEVVHFLHLILTISLNHHRGPHFYDKIAKILQISSKFYQPFISNDELFTFFQQSKPILLSLIKSKIIIIDEIIFNFLLNFIEMKGNDNHYYFYPELKEIIETSAIQQNIADQYKIELKEEDIEKFELNRRTFENESKFCSIIRDDLIDDFIVYVNENSIPLESCLQRSIFETNSFLIEKESTLIEYAFFFGSIQIIKYLDINKVKLTPSLWLYAVHSDNPEVIEFLEEKNIDLDERTFSEAIKCHHNSIAHYIYDKLFDIQTNIKDLSFETISSIYSFDNYEFFSNEVDGYNLFFNVCQSGHDELADYHLISYKKEIEDFIKQQESNEIDIIIRKALNENKLDVTYYLLSKLESIPDGYFQFKRFEVLALPHNIKSIGSNAFDRCFELKQIAIPSSVTLIEEGAFLNCSSLAQITIPSSVTSIGNNSFAGCSSLTQITIPSSVTYIGEDAFSGCSSLTQLIIPSSVTSIENSTFSDCSSLTQIIIPSSVTSIGVCAFSGCSSLTQIIIPSSVTSIGISAFKFCSALTKITIPSSVTEIGCGFIAMCPKLNKITIIQNEEKLIENFDEKILISKSCPMNEFDTIVWVNSTINILTIPSFIKKIGDSSLEGCSSLTQITIPSSVTSIGDYSFRKCSSLTQITIPSSVTSIGNYTFNKCSSLTQIIIPSSVTSIGEATFDQCSSLTQITIPSSVTSIGNYAFNKCSSLTQITIPSSVTSIGDAAFGECSSLTQITIPSSVTSIGWNAFDGCSSLTQITIPYSVAYIGDYAFKDCSSLMQIKIPSSLNFNRRLSGIKTKTKVIKF